MKGIYIGEVAEILGLSLNRVSQLVEGGELDFFQSSPTSRRIFNKEQVLAFAKTQKCKSIRKNRRMLAYIRCKTKKQERKILQQIKLYCARENWKLSPITQLDRGDNETNNLAYNKAVQAFRANKVQGLVYFGQTQDVRDLTKMFCAIPELKVLDASTDLVKSTPDEITDSGLIRTQTTLIYS